MSSLFKMLLQMSITASYVIAAVLVFRILLRNYPKRYSYYLWFAVLFRMCCPFSFSSVFSIFNLSFRRGENVIIDLSGVPVASGNDAQGISSPIDLGAPQITETIKETFTAPAVNSPVPAVPSEVSKSPVSLAYVLLIVWIAGIAALLTYALIKYLRMRKELSFSVPLRDNIRQAEIRSPFLMGLFKPVIYVPFSSDETSLEMSIAHERYHIQRKDHWVRALSFLLLCVHWMNPLCWAAYHLMIKDMEMSCDEHVLEGEKDLRTAYSDALLNFAVERNALPVGPMDFGGSNVKERISNVLKYRNANRMKTVFAILMCVLMLASCAFNGKVPSALDPSSDGPGSTGYPVSDKSSQMQPALGGALGHWTVSTPSGVYYLESENNKSSSIIMLAPNTNTQKKLSDASEISNDETLLTDANRNCLLTMSFSTGSFVINRMEMDGTGKTEVVNLKGYFLDYFDRNTIQTRGSKLYVPLRKDSVRELVEIDVDTGESKTVYTFSENQFVYGGFNDRIVFRTYLGEVEGTDQNAAFSPIRSYRFDAYDTDTGETETLLEADLPYVSYYYGYSIMSMTWEDDRYVIHTYNLSTGKETVKDLDVTPEFLTDEPNRTIKWITLGEALDNSHFTLGYCEFDGMEDGWPVFKAPHYCVVDAGNGKAFSYDEVYKDCDVRVPGDAIVFAETDTAFYFTSTGGGYVTVVYAVPKVELLQGKVNGLSVISKAEDPDSTPEGEPEYGEKWPDKNTAESLSVPGEWEMSWPVRKCLRIWRVEEDDCAVDFISSPGMEAVAAFDGIVTTYGYDNYYGTYLMILHGGGIQTIYTHLLSVEVGPGATVSQGDVIGYIGEKSDDVGAHLEFYVFSGGSKVDAEPYLQRNFRGGEPFTD